MPRAAVSSVASSAYHSFPQPVKTTPSAAATLKMGASRNSGDGGASTDEKNERLLRADNVGPTFYYAHGQGQVINNQIALGAAFQGSMGEGSTYETPYDTYNMHDSAYSYFSHHDAFHEKRSQQKHTHITAVQQTVCGSQDDVAAVDFYVNAPYGYSPDGEEEEGAAAAAGAGEEECVHETTRTIKHAIAHAGAGAGGIAFRSDYGLNTNALPFGEAFHSAVDLVHDDGDDDEAHFAENEEDYIAISDSTCVSEVLAGDAEEGEEAEKELSDLSPAAAAAAVEGGYNAPARLPPHLSYLDDDADEDNDNSSDPAVHQPCSDGTKTTTHENQSHVGRYEAAVHDVIHDACDQNTIAANSSSFTRYFADHNEERNTKTTTPIPTHCCSAPPIANKPSSPLREEDEDEGRPNDVAASRSSSSRSSKPPLLPFPAAFPLSSSSAISHNTNNTNNNNTNSTSESNRSDKHFSSCKSSLTRVSSSPLSDPASRSSGRDHHQYLQNQPHHYNHHHHQSLYSDNEATVPIMVTGFAVPPLPLAPTTTQSAQREQHIGLGDYDEEEEGLYCEEDESETPLVKGEGPHYCEDTPLGMIFSLSSEEGEVLLHRTHFAERRRIIARIALRNVPDDRMRLSKIASRVAGHMLVSYDAFALYGFQPFIVHDAREWAEYVDTREGLSQTERCLMKTSDHACPSYWRVAPAQLQAAGSSSSSRIVVYSRASVFRSPSGKRNFIQVMFDCFAHSVKFFTEPLTFFAALCYLDRIHAYYYATLVNGLAPADAPAPMRLYEGHYVRIFITLMIISCKMHSDLKSIIRYFVSHVNCLGLSGLTCEEIVLFEREVLNVLGFNAHVSKTHVQSLLASFASTEEKDIAESLLFY